MLRFRSLSFLVRHSQTRLFSAAAPNKDSSSFTKVKKMPTGSKKRKLSGAEPVKNAPPVTKQKIDDEFLATVAASRSSMFKSVEEFQFQKKRVRVLTKAQDMQEDCRGIVYWMSRDQRVQDNWAFLYAQKLALKMEIPLCVCFCLVPSFLEATIRHYTFMIEGLKEVEKECIELGIQFQLLIGTAKDVLPDFIRKHDIGGVVTDFSPLRVPRDWVDGVVKALPENVPLCQVDAHNIVPCWEASIKQEYAARTIRNKINKQLPNYLTEFPPLVHHKYTASSPSKAVNWEAAYKSLEVDNTVGPVDWAKPGYIAAINMLDSFCKDRLKHFASDRNNPNMNALSNLSPWIHFGQISVQRCILVVRQHRSQWKEAVDSYMEEAIIRRELADNFCFYNKNYDKLEGAYSWAVETLKSHEGDTRSYLYTRQQLAASKTHDPLWNAAQNEMVNSGKMHGFMRMYWAKKILEWTSSPAEALQIAIHLNDKYSLDGRDPNGYVGCMWSICGIHDQGWKERAIFGKIRYMNYQGCRRKFDVAKYEAAHRKQITK